MALSRKFLKAMGLTEEQIDSVVEAHRETVDGLQKSLTAAEEKAKKFDEVEKELNELKSKGTEDYKAKYEAEHTAFESYKSDVTAKETKAAKEKAVSTYYESKNITGKNLSIAMRGSKAEIDGIELDENGKIKDTSALDTLVSGDYAGLVVTTKTVGADTPTPPKNTGGGAMTRDEIMKITNTSERQKAWAEYLSKGES